MSDETRNRIKEFVDIGGLLRSLTAAGVAALAVVFAWGQSDARRMDRIERLDVDGSAAFKMYKSEVNTKLSAMSDIVIETRNDVKWLMRQGAADK